MSENDLIDSDLDSQVNRFSKRSTRIILSMLVSIMVLCLLVNEWADWFKDDVLHPDFFNKTFRFQVRIYLLIYFPIISLAISLVSSLFPYRKISFANKAFRYWLIILLAFNSIVLFLGLRTFFMTSSI
jgi:hypothetical protein